MKRFIILLLLICLAKLAGAQSPESINEQSLLTMTTTAGTLVPNTGINGVNPAVIKALLARTQQLQAENQVLRGQVVALRARQGADNSSIKQAVKDSTAKVMFVVCLVAGLLLVALVSGQVFPRGAYASGFNLHNR
jgi:L-cysteine desulfidase